MTHEEKIELFKRAARLALQAQPERTGGNDRRYEAPIGNLFFVQLIELDYYDPGRNPDDNIWRVEVQGTFSTFARAMMRPNGIPNYSINNQDAADEALGVMRELMVLDDLAGAVT